MSESSLIIKFPDESSSFCYGVEYGRILQQMEQGDSIVSNHGFPIRVENKSLIEETCKVHGYIPSFGTVFMDEWIEFLGVKKLTTDN